MNVVFDNPPSVHAAGFDYYITPNVATRVYPRKEVSIMLKGVIVEFSPSISTDVVGYRIYYVETSEELDFESPYISITDLSTNGDGNIEVDLSTFAEFDGLDGVYDLGLSSIDDASNESSTMAFLEAVPLDFVLPIAPSYFGLKG